MAGTQGSLIGSHVISSPEFFFFYLLIFFSPEFKVRPARKADYSF